MTGLLPFAAALLVAAAPTPPHATPPLAHEQVVPAGNMELVVVEAAGCAYCSLLRKSILPGDVVSLPTRELPVRFVDARDQESGDIALTRPVDVVPTAVLMRDGAEVGRISGYVGRQNFLRSINYLMLRLR